MAILTTIGNNEWDPNRSEKQCAYCSEQLIGSIRTKEDIWPRWLQNKFPQKKGERFRHFTRKSFIGDNTKGYGRTSLRVKIPWLCQKCNNEFSSEIQESVKPAIHNALSRKINTFGPKDLEMFCRWACLSAMTWEFADKETKAISQIEREEFRKTGKVPENFSILMGRYGGTGFQFIHQHINYQSLFSTSSSEAKIGDNVYILESGQVTTIGVGSIFLLINSRKKFGETLGENSLGRDPFSSKFLHPDFVDLTAPGGAIFLPDAFSPLNDDELQDLALGFVSQEVREGVRRIGPIPNLSPDFWRSDTTEPDWQ